MALSACGSDPQVADGHACVCDNDRYAASRFVYCGNNLALGPGYAVLV